jgi:hypothetical protein
VEAEGSAFFDRLSALVAGVVHEGREGGAS